jgi:hypothetical protein
LRHASLQFGDRSIALSGWKETIHKMMRQFTDWSAAPFCNKRNLEFQFGTENRRSVRGLVEPRLTVPVGNQADWDWR